MIARAFVVATMSVAAATPAYAWESVCRQYADTTLDVDALAATNAPACTPDAGPNTARQRWIGPLDEHRALFERTLKKAGMPASFSHTTTVTTWSDGSPVDVAGAERASFTPTSFESAARVVSRSFTPGELAQLPDFSYALWDWSEGNESCPLDDSVDAADAVACHDFATHMGPVNANHFVPQSQRFYAHDHALALARAAECRAMNDALASSSPRFDGFVLACEIEALTIEAMGQHYLQDAWSTGHMWQRWGSSDLEDFEGSGDDKRDRAVLVALTSGLIHGARGVLQKIPEWAGLDVDDAMCAPNDDVTFIAKGGGEAHGVGDDFLDALTDDSLQARSLFSCAASGVLEVYGATAMKHGALGTLDAGVVDVDPTSDACFGQRATNRAILAGAAIDLKVAGQQLSLPLDARVTGMLLPNVARTSGQVPVDAALRNELRLSLQRVVTVARILAAENPDGTDAADGALGPLLGAKPNAAYADRAPPSSYADPPLPWPASSSSSSSSSTDVERAFALARLFHEAHAADWCAAIDDATLAAIVAHPRDAALDAAAHDAACDACATIAVRHLRVGTPEAWDTAEEPLCTFLVDTPSYIYEAPTSSSNDPAVLVRLACGC